MNEALISAQQLGVGHGRRVLAEAMQFELYAGEVVALLGPNGGGKTTLFRTLLGLLPPLHGTLMLQGRPLAQWSRAELARTIGYVPQQQAQQFSYSALDVVLMGRAARVAIFSQPNATDRRIALGCLEQLGIGHLALRSQSELSGGERQLVGIARALAQEPRLLIMDEPTASLDFGNQQRVLEQIERLPAQGVTVLLSTHQPEHALRVAQRIALLGQGRWHGPGAARDIVTSAQLAQLYGVSEAAIKSALPTVSGVD